MFISYDYGNTWERILHIPGWENFKLSKEINLLFNRLFRRGIHHIITIDSDIILIIANSRVYRYNMKSFELTESHLTFPGSRPLTISKDVYGNVYLGEYYSNPRRNPVNIYRSSDGGKGWDKINEIREIRHIHGIFYDNYSNLYWVTTGDSDDESGIWMTMNVADKFRKFIGGSQQTRAIHLLFSQNYIYFGSDTPNQPNYIFRINRKTKHIDRLQKVDSSVFWGCKIGNNLFFSTAIETSKINNTKEACIWWSPDGERWKCITKYHKDVWHMKLFQYGQIYFPAGINETDYLFYTPFATEHHLIVQRLRVSNLKMV